METTQYIMYNMEIHKLYKKAPKNKNYHFLKKSHRIQMYLQILVLTFFKFSKKGAKPKNV